MVIEYMGHSCVIVKDFQDTGYKVVFDPYKKGSVPGYRDLEDEGRANVVLCSHEHDDHYGMDNVRVEPFEGECPFEIQKIESYHDPEHGALRGKNTIHIVTLKASGEKVIHYGDIGQDLDELLTPENLNLLSGADFAFVPCGGVYTYDADQAIELIDRTKPKTAIAMHFRSDIYKCGYPNIATEQEFMMRGMETCHDVQLAPYSYIDTYEDVLPYDIMALMPECSLANPTAKR